MDIGNKILELRKKHNLSQEALAEKMNVARQTISKWELGETSPDIKQAKELSKIFNVSLDELTNNDIKDVVIEKVSNTEKLAGLILKIIKIFLIGIPLCFLILFISIIIFRNVKNIKNPKIIVEESIHCTLYGEEHGYSISYDELTGRIVAEGGDTYFSDILDLGEYNDAHQVFNVINDYVKKNGGTCNMVEGKDLNNTVDMYIKEGTLTNTSATVVIEDKNPNKIVYGQYFYIERYNNGNWESVNTISEDYFFNDIAYYVDDSGVLEMRHDWTHIYGPLPKGLYRLVKDVFFESDIPIDDSNKYYIWTEFEI